MNFLGLELLAKFKALPGTVVYPGYIYIYIYMCMYVCMYVLMFLFYKFLDMFLI